MKGEERFGEALLLQNAEVARDRGLQHGPDVLPVDFLVEVLLGEDVPADGLGEHTL